MQEGIVKNLKWLGLDGQALTAGKSGKTPPGQLNGTGGQSNPAEPNRYYFHPDHLGSTSYITDATGEVYQHLEYFAFGETFVEEHSNTDRTPYLYNGKELDEETGLYYYGARYYDAQASVWVSVDPLAEKYPGLSGYNYVANNPLKFVDPDGRVKIPWTKLIEGRTYGDRTGGNAFSQARKNPVDGKVRRHTGIDLGYLPGSGSLKGGEHIRSAARGTVVEIGKSKSYGNYIIIDHGEGYKTRYNHIKDAGILVVEGQVIKNGEIIAKVGSTGRSTGPHLHFELLKDGKFIDPTTIYDLDEFLYGKEQLESQLSPETLDKFENTKKKIENMNNKLLLFQEKLQKINEKLEKQLEGTE